MKKPAIKKLADFDHLAAPYRWMEYLSFGPLLQRCRCALLERTAGARNALVLGDGDGRFTRGLLTQNPSVRVHAIDGSPAMLQALLHRAGSDASRVETEQADLREWVPTRDRQQAGYDLIASHFFLDCLTTDEVRALAEKVRNTIAPSAVWLVSEFLVPPKGFGKLIAVPLVAILYWSFARLTGLEVRRLPDHAAALQSAGFTLVKQRTTLFGLLVSEEWTTA
jgi:hypothetical protein